MLSDGASSLLSCASPDPDELQQIHGLLCESRLWHTARTIAVQAEDPVGDAPLRRNATDLDERFLSCHIASVFLCAADWICEIEWYIEKHI